MGYKITDEEINKVKLNSPFALPNSPTERGMKPEAIKEMFWKPFAVLTEFINKYLSALGEGMATDKSDVINQINSLRNGLSKEVASLVNTRLDEAFELVVPRQEFDTHIENYEGKVDENIERINGLEGGLEVVESIAKGANQAVAFGNYEEFVYELNSAENDKYKIGQNIYIGTREVPDLWISGVVESHTEYTYTSDEEIVGILNDPDSALRIGYYYVDPLETQKVDLTDYATKEDLGAKLDINKNTSTLNQVYAKAQNGNQVMINVSQAKEANAIPRYNVIGNIQTGTPGGEYDCANKQYVDDLLGDIATALTELHNYAMNLKGGEA